MKRLTDTGKWRDPWFRRLSPEAKLLWIYMCDNCDAIGLLELDLEAASFEARAPIKQIHLAELESRIQTTFTGKIFLTKFINFQYKNLSTSCPPHRAVISLMNHHGLIKNGVGHRYPEAGEAKGSVEHDPSQVITGNLKAAEILELLNEQSGCKHPADDGNLKVISEKLKETGEDYDGIMKMVRRQCEKWKNDAKMSDCLRPCTLFGDNFKNYYAAKDQPVPQPDGKPPRTMKIVGPNAQPATPGGF